MINFFRGNYPSRLFALLILFFLLRVPLLLFGVPLTTADLHHFLIGERMADGFSLYSQIYDPVAPLSAAVFWVIDLLAGRADDVYLALGSGLLLVQALRINTIFNRNKVHPEKSYLPAIVYVLAGSIFFEYDRVSPMLLGVTCLVFALSYFSSFSEGGDNSNQSFKGGLLLGLAALFYLPMVWYLAVGVFAIMYFASHSFRNVLLLLVAFLFPFAIAGTYYLYTDALNQFLTYHIAEAALLGRGRLLPVNDLLLLLWPMLLLLLAAFFQLYAESSSLNFRVRFQQLMVLWLLVSVPVIMSGGVVSVRSYAVLLPAVAYFSMQAFAVRKPVWISETLFWIIAVGVVWSRYGHFLASAGLYAIDTSNLVVSENPYPAIRNKKVLVLGDNQSVFLQNKPATPYLHWPIAAKDFGNISSYNSIYRIDKNIRADMPDVIVDENGLMPKLHYHLPVLMNEFKAVDGKKVWIRKETAD